MPEQSNSPNKDVIIASLARYKIEHQELIESLRSVGLRIDATWELREIKIPYPLAIPILLSHLNKSYSPTIRSGIIDGLSKKWAKDEVWDAIVAAYRIEPNLSRVAPKGEIGAPSGPKDAMANGLVEMATTTDMDQMIELIENPKNGPSRVLLTGFFSRSRQKRAFDTLARLSSDLELAAEIEHILKRKLRRAAKEQSKRGTVIVQ